MRVQSKQFDLRVAENALNAFQPYEPWLTLLNYSGNYSDNYSGQSGVLQREHAGNDGHEAQSPIELELVLNEVTQRLQLLWTRATQTLTLEVTCESLIKSLTMTHTAKPKKGPLNKAIGRRTQRIFDATGGWGNDSMLFAEQGMRVVCAERNPILAMMLHHTFKTLQLNAPQQDPREPVVPSAYFGSADAVYAELLNQPEDVDIRSFDCVYFDPMFPPKRKKSAKSNKQMQFAQALLSGDPDASQIAEALLELGAKRLVVKRPSYATALLPSVSHTFNANLVDYDVYLNY